MHCRAVLFSIFLFSNVDAHCSTLNSRIVLKHASLNRTMTIVQDFQSGVLCGYLLPSLYSQMLDSLDLMEELDTSIRNKAASKNYYQDIIDPTSAYFSMGHTVQEILDKMALCIDASLPTLNKLKIMMTESRNSLAEYLLSTTTSQYQVACHLNLLETKYHNATTNHCSRNQPFLVHNNTNDTIGPVKVTLASPRMDVSMDRIGGVFQLDRNMMRLDDTIRGIVLRPSDRDNWGWEMYYHEAGHDYKLAKINNQLEGVAMDFLSLVPTSTDQYNTGPDVHDTVRVRVRLSQCVAPGNAIYLLLADDCTGSLSSIHQRTNNSSRSIYLPYFEPSPEIYSVGWKIESDKMCSCDDY